MVMHTLRGSNHEALRNAAGNSINDRTATLGSIPMGHKSFLLTAEPRPTIAPQSVLL
jgi:hypothetical protein